MTLISFGMTSPIFTVYNISGFATMFWPYLSISALGFWRISSISAICWIIVLLKLEIIVKFWQMFLVIILQKCHGSTSLQLAVKNFAHNVLPFSCNLEIDHIFLCNVDILNCDGKRKICLNENWECVIQSSLKNLIEFQVKVGFFRRYYVACQIANIYK